MSLIETLALGLVIVFVAVALLRLIATPLKIALRLILHSALGFGAVWLLNATSAVSGLSLGLNVFNALTIGILGLPGLGLLLLLQWVLT
ncbi:MAG: Pro-sigmaK processing inhibitor BofA [Ruminococcaceae bacterium]|nr:Pro-sigmaK processing inhibitor BofA [Oscillospiraceae bacterium]